MGVPSFFRWLQKYYPQIISNCIETNEDSDPSQPNPNTEGEREFDCLYLDMNGIIHPCFHPSGTEAPKDENEIMNNVYQYITRIFNLVRPRKVLFMAIDGVAPRAKMNQQRSRRFRAAKDAQYKGENKQDSNVITPGTEFMARLAENLRLFISKMQVESTAWSSISIILSDSSVPGEGEHKVLDFIRGQRFKEGYDPNTKHCIYGLDADLFFLGLATHEVFMYILREDIIDTHHLTKTVDRFGPGFFQFASLWVFRQYLQRDLCPSTFKESWNFERSIDDFIFLCFTAGNDFLPHLHGINIAQGAVSTIIDLYQDVLSTTQEYVTNNGEVNFQQLKKVIKGFNDSEKKALRSVISPNAQSVAAQELANKICNVENPQIDQLAEKRASYTRNINNNDTEQVIPYETSKQIYYSTKLSIDVENSDMISQIVTEYILGMKWCLHYYLHGVVSWNWFYPYLYPPLISDFQSVEDVTLPEFRLSRPLKPLSQLMAVLPPQSSNSLPSDMAKLMIDEESPLKPFYPTMFSVDLCGGNQIWKGVVNIPFIDSRLLQKTIKKSSISLTKEETKRNTHGSTHIFISQSYQTNQVFGDFYLISESLPNEYVFEYPIIDKAINVSVLLEGVQIPPNIIDVEQKSHSAWRSNHVKDPPFSLQQPGYPIGKTPRYRKDQTEILKPKSQKKGKSVFDF